MAETVPLTPDARDYDVAISFLAADEPLALQIEQDLAPLKVFVYSKKQEELAGRDGDEAFGEVFRRRCRLAVVLYRPKWGMTRWTRIEESAIRDLCFDGERGADHIMFVHLERVPPPAWVSPRKIYLDYELFGLARLIGAIQARCLDLGIELRAPSAVERARALADAQRFAQETEQTLRSCAQPLYDTARVVFDGLAARLNEIAEAAPEWRGTSAFDTTEFVAVTNGRSLQLTCTWLPRQGGAHLELRMFTGQILTPAQRRSGRWLAIAAPMAWHHETYALTRVPGVGWCWEASGRKLTSDQLAEHAANQLVSALQHPVDNTAEVLGEIFRPR